MPQQVQDFYPTPGTLSTAMYYTEIDPRTMKPVYVAKTPEEKAMQRALLQWRRPEKRPIIVSALRKAGREDLIGFGKDCLIRPLPSEVPRKKPSKQEERRQSRPPKHGGKTKRPTSSQKGKTEICTKGIRTRDNRKGSRHMRSSEQRVCCLKTDSRPFFCTLIAGIFQNKRPIGFDGDIHRNRRGFTSFLNLWVQPIVASLCHSIQIRLCQCAQILHVVWNPLVIPLTLTGHFFCQIH